MRRARILLFSLMVAMGVLFAASESQAQVCFSWLRSTFPGPLVGGPLVFVPEFVPQTYVIVFDPAVVVGSAAFGNFVTFTGRHEGACGAGTSRPITGTAWFRGNRVELGVLTYGMTTSTVQVQPPFFSPTQCGLIQARASVDATTLAGTIKYQELSGTSAAPFALPANVTPVTFELDTTTGPPINGLPFGLSFFCPPAAAAN